MIKDRSSIANLIMRHLQGELTAEEKILLDDWISESKENEQLFGDLTDTTSMLKKLNEFHVIETSNRKVESQHMLEATLFSSAPKIIPKSSKF